MFKKYIQKLTPAILSILLVALAILPIAVWAAGPSEPETRTLTVEFSLDQCTVELWYHDSDPAREPQKLVSGAPVEVPYGEKNVEVRVIPANGYELQSIYQIKSDGKQEGPWLSWATSQFNEPVKLKIECKPKTYEVSFVPEKDEDLVSYRFPSDVAEQYTNLKFTYLSSDIVIEPVEKTSRGYTFKRWELVYKVDGVDVPLTLPVNAEGKWIIPASLTIQDQWQDDGKLYLRPVFDPNQYPVWWYDFEMDSDDNNVTTPLRPDADKSMEYMGTKVNLQWKADSYPGYVLNEGKCVSYAVDVDDSVDGIDKINRVYRYFDPIFYTLKFEMKAGVACQPEDFAPGVTVPTVHIFNKDTNLPQASRPGYHFGGWSVIVNGKVVDHIYNLDQLYLTKRKTDYALENADQTITLRAEWISKVYDIEYDLGDVDPTLNTLPQKYTFNSALKIPVPVRRGYDFLGWKVNGSDTLVLDLTLEAESYLDTIHLCAVWEAKQFDVVLDPNGGTPTEPVTLPNKVVYDSQLDTTGFIPPKRSQYKFLGYFYADVKYINADGSSVFEKWDLDGTGSITLTAKWELLPVIDVNPDDYQLNFKTEKFQFPQGTYRLTFGDETVEFIVSADGSGSVQIPESFFGNAVKLTVCTTDDTLYSDYHNDAFLVPARPEAPTQENHVIDRVSSTATSISINFKDGVDVSLYEISLYLNGEMIYPWGNVTEFEGLQEGTTYVVLIRVKATDTVPASISTRVECSTDSDGVKIALRAELDAMVQPDDGEMVRELIAQAKEQITALKHSPTFNEEARKIVEETAEAVKLARLQDQNIAALKEYRDELLEKYSYDEENKDLINSLFEKAEKDIQNATADTAIRDIYENAHREMSDIKVISLQFGDLILIGSNGLHKDHILTLDRLFDFTAQADLIANAVLEGKVIPVDGMSAQELINLLKTQDVLAAYTMSLSPNDYVGSFKVTLLLPEELRGARNLRVAYFDDATGTLHVLETETEGDYLTFMADTISDFVIIGDPIVNVIIPLVALSVVVLCQLIALALLLKSRKESGWAVRHYSFVMPAALTVQFFPQYGELMVLILGALVIVLQIVLTVLLLKSKIIHKSLLRRRGESDAMMTMATPEDLFEESKPIDPALMYENQNFSQRSDESAFMEEISSETEALYDEMLSEDHIYDDGEGADEIYYAPDDLENPFMPAQDEELYDADVYDEASEISEEAPDIFADSTTYSLDETTGELYEDPYGAYSEELLTIDETVYAQAFSNVEGEATELAPDSEGTDVVPEDAEAPIFTFEDEDIAYGDPAEPPYEDDAAQGDPEEKTSADNQ